MANSTHHKTDNNTQTWGVLGSYVEYCYSTNRPKYAGGCRHIKGIPRHMTVRLSPDPILHDFEMYYSLDNSGAVYNGTTIFAFPDSPHSPMTKSTELPGQRILEYRSGSTVFFLTDEGGRVHQTAICRGKSKYCTIRVLTERGVVFFPSFGPHDLDIDRWANDFQKAEAMFNAWRCTEPTCGGHVVGAIMP